MKKMKMFLVVGLVLCVAGSASAGLITDSDLVDMSNTIVAQNFWDVEWSFGGVPFLSTGALGSGTGDVGGVANNAAWGYYGGIPTLTIGAEAPQWNGFYGGAIYSADQIDFTTVFGNGDYIVNILLFEQWVQAAKNVTLTSEGASVTELLSDGTDGYGHLLSLATTVTDGALEFSVFEDPAAASNMHIGALYIQQVVPEPATMAILGLGGLFLRRRKR